MLSECCDDDGARKQLVECVGRPGRLSARAQLRTLLVHHLHGLRWNARRCWRHRQQLRFRRLLEGQHQDVGVVSLPRPVAHRLSTVVDCPPALFDRVIRRLHGLAEGVLGHKPVRTCIPVASGANSSDGHDMGDRTGRRQPLHRRLFAVQGVAIVHRLEGEEAVGLRASLRCAVQHPEVC